MPSIAASLAAALKKEDIVRLKFAAPARIKITYIVPETMTVLPKFSVNCLEDASGFENVTYCQHWAH